MNIYEVKGKDLSENEFTQIITSIGNEFGLTIESKESLSNKLFFLLKEKEKILSMGAFISVDPVYFAKKKYSFLGVVNVISVQKEMGYGRAILTSMRNYLDKTKQIGLGFCMAENEGFYKKCGFETIQNISKNFVYKKGNEIIVDQNNQVVFYYDPKDNFMKSVIEDLSQIVYLPGDFLW